MSPSIPDPHITLASLAQDYEQVHADYVASNFRTSLRTLLCETDMMIDAAYATGILSFSATRVPDFSSVVSANGRVISLYQLAMFMDIIDFSWTLVEYKPYIQGDDFNDLDKEFCTLLGLTVLNSKDELRGKIEQERGTTNRVFCFTGHLESGITAALLSHVSPDLYVGRELEDIARQLDHVCSEYCPPVCTAFMMDVQQLRPYQKSEGIEHVSINRDRALTVQGYRASGIIAAVDNLAESRHSHRLPSFEPRSFVKPFEAMAVHWPVERL